MNGRKNIGCRNNKKKTTEYEGYKLTYILREAHGIGKHGTIFSVTVSIEMDTYRDEMTAFDITRSRKTAERIFKLLYDNTVTPCTLMDVLSDVL